MKINLRKAANAVQALQDYCHEVRGGFAPNVSVSIHGNLATAIERGREGYLKRLETLDKVVSAQYEIRRKIGEANLENGISKLLSDIAELDAKITFNGDMARVASMDDEEIAVLERRMALVLEEATNPASIGNRRTNENFNVAVLTPADKEAIVAKVVELKRQRRQAQDRLLATNVKTEIEISDNAREILEGLGVL